jgi:hypothetical protein
MELAFIDYLSPAQRTPNKRVRSRTQMRIFVALLIALAILYFWDVNYNNGTLSDGVIRLTGSMLHHSGR